MQDNLFTIHLGTLPAVTELSRWIELESSRQVEKPGQEL